MNAKPKRSPTTDAVEIIHRRYYEGRPDRLASLEEERANAHIARRIYDLREKAGLTQPELARLIGASTQVVRQLEDSDYDGNYLTLLRRIAAALQRRVKIRMVPIKPKLRSVAAR